MFYVYIHRKKTNGEVFYVGKGKGKRIRDTSGRNSSWKKTVAAYGIVHEYYIKDIQEWYALELEQELIAYYGRMDQGCGTLVNMQDSDTRPIGNNIVTGIASPNADKARHLFRNLKTKEEFSGTRFDFIEKYNPKKYFTNHLFNCDVTVSNDWIVVDRFSQDEYDKIIDEYENRAFARRSKTKYTFTNAITKEEIYCDWWEFYSKTGISPSNIATYITAAKKNLAFKHSLKGEWFIKELISEDQAIAISENRKGNAGHVAKRDLSKIKFFNFVDGINFTGDRWEFIDCFGFDPFRIVSKGSVTLNGWCIPSNISEDCLDNLIKNKGISNKGCFNNNADKSIYNFKNAESKDEFTGTRVEFFNKYGIDLTTLFSKKPIIYTCKLWYLKENEDIVKLLKKVKQYFR